MKVCSKCGIEKDESEFYKHKTTKDKLEYGCKECRNQTKREWYNKPENREKHRQVSREWLENPVNREKTRQNARRHNKNTSLFSTKLKYSIIKQVSDGCIICGFNRSMTAIDFHHIDQSLKDLAFGKTIHFLSGAKSEKNINKRINELQFEFDKGIVPLCSNCHSMIHWEPNFELPDLEVPVYDIRKAYLDAIEMEDD